MIALMVGPLALANPDVADAPLFHAGEATRLRLYAKVEEVDGRARARWRRKQDAEFHVDELADGTIVRVRRMARGAVIEDHRYDAGGGRLVTIFYGAGGVPERAVVHSQPEQEVPLAGWTSQALPGGTMAAPSTPVDIPGGSVRLEVLDGELDVWTGPAADPLSAGFREGIAAGCGCIIVERAVAWVDGRPGVRYRLLVPDIGPSEPVDLWAVPVPDGLWLATFRISPGPPGAVASGPDAEPTEDRSARLLGGRVLMALVDLEDAGAR
jgi:hypothetical protein